VKLKAAKKPNMKHEELLPSDKGDAADDDDNDGYGDDYFAHSEDISVKHDKEDAKTGANDVVNDGLNEKRDDTSGK
jgi:hypothetical protein